MRRHPVADLTRRALGATGTALLLAGCLAVGPRSTGTPSAPVSVTIGAAAGDTPAFEPAEVTVQTDGPVVVVFRNGSSVAHNLVFTAGVAAATRTIVEPGTSDRLVILPPNEGTYPFVCTIHEGMAGVLLVQSARSGDGAVASHDAWTVLGRR